MDFESPDKNNGNNGTAQKIKIFWKQQCPKCPLAKEVGSELVKEGADVVLYDVGTVDGLAEASFHSVLATPTIVIVDGDDNELKAWRGSVPALEEIKALVAHKIGHGRE